MKLCLCILSQTKYTTDVGIKWNNLLKVHCVPNINSLKRKQKPRIKTVIIIEIKIGFYQFNDRKLLEKQIALL